MSKPTKLDRALVALETIAHHAGAVVAMVKAGEKHYKATKRRATRK